MPSSPPSARRRSTLDSPWPCSSSSALIAFDQSPPSRKCAVKRQKGGREPSPGHREGLVPQRNLHARSNCKHRILLSPVRRYISEGLVLTAPGSPLGTARAAA